MPVLFFLYVLPDLNKHTFLTHCPRSSDASPLYLLLFLSATYFLNRPCVYCSLLLAVLVFALFDFKADWFEPRHLSSANNSLPRQLESTTACQHILHTGASLALSALNATTSAFLNATSGQLGKRLRPKPDWSGMGLEWAKGLSGRRELRVPCINAIIRL